MGITKKKMETNVVEFLGSGFRVWCLRLGVWGSGFGVKGLGYGVWGFGVLGLGFRA